MCSLGQKSLLHSDNLWWVVSCRPIEHTWKACCLQHHSCISSWLRFFHCLVLVINSWDSTSFIMTRLCTGESGVWILAGAKGHFCKMSKPAVVPTRLPVQLVLGAVSLGVEWPGCETNHLPPSSAQVKFEWRYTSCVPLWLIQGQLCPYLQYSGVNFVFPVMWYIYMCWTRSFSHLCKEINCVQYVCIFIYYYINS